MPNKFPGRHAIRMDASMLNQIRSDSVDRMKKLTVTEVARNFSAVMDRLEAEQEEIVLIRNQRAIARLTPEPPEQNALVVLGDLYRRLDDGTAEALAKAVKRTRKGKNVTLDALRNPWAS